jgi:hypothetical protein
MRQFGKALAAVVMVFGACNQGFESPSATTTRLLGDDPDRDGIMDIADNCPLEPNANQLNRDGDEYGDVCDPCPSTLLNGEGCPQDDDGDGVANLVDNCPTVPNSEQEDQDGDRRGDACERGQGSDCDADRDGLCAEADNCPTVSNSYQSDGDRDGIGDACDDDDDGDGVSDGADACATTALAATVDRQGCSLADSCPCEGPWKGHSAFVACVSRTSLALVSARLLPASQRSEAVADASASACGKPPEASARP